MSPPNPPARPTDRQLILARVREALAPLTERASLPDWERELVVRRSAPETPELWTLFSERLRAVNGTPLDRIEDLVTLLRSNQWLHGYCDPALLPSFAAAFGPDFVVETEFDRARVDDYQFGITLAVGAIAETGTLILDDASTSSRLAALAPWVHVAVLRRPTIHPDLPRAVSVLGQDPNVIWVTGPSKTADVEGILIEGVHGPGVQVALLLH
jgi:L-lactate dehydrogenase complex protein LldG